MCIFVISNKYKGYKCLYPSIKRIYISHNVVFDGSAFIFANPSSLYDTYGTKIELFTY